ncbi:MAG: hypothetical protein LBS00_09840 [Synergistaceae bacterium]|jgi:hypothetical protein|nr:hypothetical protein [Synergistaceae bacterium]
MATQYTLQITNNSTHYGSLCVYATPVDPDKIQFDLRSLAWFSKAANPNTSVTFSWPLQYSFVWSETGKLVPAVTFIASESQDADPSDANSNRAYFDIQGGAYKFGQPSSAKPAAPGTLAITTSGSIPDSKAAIGVGIGGKPALVVNAAPNYMYTFIPKIKYWVAFGNFIEGEVLDLNAMTSIHEISYPVNEYVKSVILNADNTWSEGVSFKEFNDRIRGSRPGREEWSAARIG